MSPVLQTFTAESKRRSSCSSVTAGNVIYLHFILKPHEQQRDLCVALLPAKYHNCDVRIHINVYFYFVLDLNRRQKITSLLNSRAGLISLKLFFSFYF
jgi:hypothetical protein